MRKSVLTAIALAFSVAGLLASCGTAPATTKEPEPVAQDDVWSILEKGDSDKARAFFQGETDVNATDSKGRTPLHIAAEKRDAQLASFFVSRGTHVETLDSSGRTALEIACANGDGTVAAVLSGAGADVFLIGSKGKSPADYALDAGAGLVAALATPKTVATADAEGRTLLHLAALRGDLSSTETLLAKGAQASVTDGRGKTPLDAAYTQPASRRHAAVAERLVLATSFSGDPAFSYFPTAVRSSNFDLRLEDGLTPLHYAARGGQTGFIELMIDRGANVNAKSSSGAPPLHEAIRFGQVEAARLLVAAGAKVNERDAKGNAALHLVMPAASRVEGLKLLLANGANPNVKDAHGDTPLHVATSMNMGDAYVAMLFEGGADPNIRNIDGRAPLHIAVERNRPSYIPLLLAKKADIFAADNAGKTPFDSALEMKGAVLDAIITSATVVTSDSAGNTPLLVAAASLSDVQTVALILDRKGDVNARNKTGDTALHIAVRENLREVGELLISRGADIFATNAEGMSPLHLAALSNEGFLDWMVNSTTISARDGLGNSILHYVAGWKRDEAIPLIVQRGGDVEARNGMKETPLFTAVKADSPTTVAVLVAEGASMATRDASGNTVLHAAVRWNARSVAVELMKIGADPDGRNLAGKAPLHDAARLGLSDMMTALLSAGASTEARDLEGATPLMDAVSVGNSTATERLVEEGADPTVRNVWGDTPLHIAVVTGRKDTATILLARGVSIHARNAAGSTPFKTALKAGPEMTSTLLTKDRLDVSDDEGRSPMHIAVMEGAGADTISTIASLGARLSATDSAGKTPLRIAVDMGKEAQVRALMDAGADVFTPAADGESPATVVFKTRPDAIRWIFDGTAIGTTDTVGNTALHFAAYVGDSVAVKLLLELGADKTKRNVAGETPADLARRWGKRENGLLLQ